MPSIVWFRGLVVKGASITVVDTTFALVSTTCFVIKELGLFVVQSLAQMVLFHSLLLPL